MSDPTPVATPAAPTAPTAPEKPATPATPTPPAEPVKDAAYWEAESEKWKTFSRKHEDTAKANADKAKRFDEFEESQKTELEKAAARAAKAEEKAAELELRAIRSEVAAAKGVPANLLTGATQEEFEASAAELLAFRGEKPKPDFGGGDRGADVPGSDSLDADIAAATAAGDFQLAIALKQRRAAQLAEKKKS